VAVPLVEVVPWVAAATVLFAVGYLTRVRGATALVAGYDESSDVPADVATRAVGNLTLGVGVATVACGVAVAATGAADRLALAVTAVVLLATAWTVYRLATYPDRSD